MDPPQHRCRPMPQCARDRVHVRVQGGHARLIGVQRHRHKSHHIGHDHQPDRPADQKARINTEIRLHEVVKRIVKGRKGKQQTHRSHATGHSIPNARNPKGRF